MKRELLEFSAQIDDKLEVPCQVRTFWEIFWGLFR